VCGQSNFPLDLSPALPSACMSVMAQQLEKKRARARLCTFLSRHQMPARSCVPPRPWPVRSLLGRAFHCEIGHAIFCATTPCAWPSPHPLCGRRCVYATLNVVPRPSLRSSLLFAYTRRAAPYPPSTPPTHTRRRRISRWPSQCRPPRALTCMVSALALHLHGRSLPCVFLVHSTRHETASCVSIGGVTTSHQQPTPNRRD
jgi:hypothetical protein